MSERSERSRMNKPYYQEIAENEYRQAYAQGREVLRYSTEAVPWLVEFSRSPYFPTGGRVIDFACGEGINSIYLAGLGCQVTGIDIAEDAIKKARELASAEGVSVDFNVGDIVSCPEVPSDSFDLALACACFGRLIEDEHRSAFLKETIRTLRKGGYLFFNNGICLKEIELSFPKVYAVLKQRPDFGEWAEEERTGNFVPPSQRYETKEGYETLLESMGYRIVHSHLDVSEQAWGIVIWARKVRCTWVDWQCQDLCLCLPGRLSHFGRLVRSEMRPTITSGIWTRRCTAGPAIAFRILSKRPCGNWRDSSKWMM